MIIIIVILATLWAIFFTIKGSFDYMKEMLLKKVRELGIEELKNLDCLNELKGDYINLELKLPNGNFAKLLNDNKMYFCNQVERNGKDRCYGIAADENQILICEYDCNGSGAELVMWIKL